MFDEVDDSGWLNESLQLTDAQLLHNIREIQSENNIRLSDSLVRGQGRVSLDVEMETGTGKTYVYIKTICSAERLSSADIACAMIFHSFG